MKQNWQNDFFYHSNIEVFFIHATLKNLRKKVRIILLCKGKDSASYFNKDNSYCIFYDYKHDEIRINQFFNEKLSTILHKKELQYISI